MDPFDKIHQTLDRIAALQESSRKEAAEREAKMDKWRAEHEKELAELRAEHQREIAALRAEEAKRQEKRNAELAELRAELAVLRAQNERERIELRQSLKSIGQKLGSIGMNNGDFAEEIFFTSLGKSRLLGGQYYDIVRRKVCAPYGTAEYDILMHNGESTAIVEVKYKARISDIHKLLAKEPETFRKAFTGFRDHNIYLGLASAVTNNELINEAREAGIFLLGQKGESFEIVNDTVRIF